LQKNLSKLAKNHYKHPIQFCYSPQEVQWRTSVTHFSKKSRRNFWGILSSQWVAVLCDTVTILMLILRIPAVFDW